MTDEAPQSDDAPSVDTNVLVRLQEQTGDEDGELLQELVDVFLEDAKETCERLHDLAAGGASETISREAHRLKSGAANLGAVQMTALCKKLERIGTDGRAEEIRDLVAQLTDQIPGVERRLRDYLEGELRTAAVS